MVPERRYRSDIPAEAVGTVVERQRDGTPSRVAYHVDGELAGVRWYFRALEREIPYRRGLRHGTEYRFYDDGSLMSAEPYKDGLANGTAAQWDEDGRLLGTYTMVRGTGIDLWWQRLSDAEATLSEVHYCADGEPHGREWWVDYTQDSVTAERHWQHGELHGIEREWNLQNRLHRGYPRYYVRGRRVDKRAYLRAAARDPSLPPFRPDDNRPQRVFPPEVAAHLGPPFRE